MGPAWGSSPDVWWGRVGRGSTSTPGGTFTLALRNSCLAPDFRLKWRAMLGWGARRGNPSFTARSTCSWMCFHACLRALSHALLSAAFAAAKMFCYKVAKCCHSCLPALNQSNDGLRLSESNLSNLSKLQTVLAFLFPEQLNCHTKANKSFRTHKRLW